MKKAERKELYIRAVLIGLAFTILFVCSAVYAFNHTDFKDSIGLENISISSGLQIWWFVGILSFIVYFCMTTEKLKIALMFLFDFALICSSALFLLAILPNALFMSFKIFLILNSFAMFFCLYKLRNIVEFLAK